MMTDNSTNDNSGILHLMEAATALTQLVGASDHAAASVSTTSPVSVGEAKALSNPISDDDSTLASSHMSMLRENHLKALQAASLATKDGSACSSVKAAPAPVPAAPSSASMGSKDKEIFPMRLHALLGDSSVRDTVSWLPHGNSFVILRPDVFATSVLPRYFSLEGSSKGGNVHKYPSFTRKLNRWGFRQISRGADSGAFYHDLFRRDEPDACLGMVCQKSRKTVRDDCKSVSSASTMSFHSGEKRTSSATVTVSTTGASARSLPPKKRRGIESLSTSSYESGIPANVTMKNNNSSLVTKKITISSDAETVSNLSADGSVSSINHTANKSQDSLDQSSADAKEALVRHFYEQHRAFALATLMENSRKAMLARGMDVESPVNARNDTSPTNEPRRESLGATTTSNVYAPTVTINRTCHNQATNQPQQSAAAEAAKNALYEAYKKALSSSS
jgi:hypothetical protein